MACKQKLNLAALRLYWVDGADPAVIDKQRQAHLGVLLDRVHNAGAEGILALQAVSETVSFLSVFEDADRARWEKCSIIRHVSWLLKKYSDYVRGEVVDVPETAPAEEAFVASQAA